MFICSCTSGYYCGYEDYYTKEVPAGLPGWKDTGKFAGYDFHDNESPAFDAKGTYSTYLYEKRATSIIQAHNTKEVRTYKM